nr:hypothetical protein [Aeromicrobium sp.]
LLVGPVARLVAAMTWPAPIAADQRS